MPLYELIIKATNRSGVNELRVDPHGDAGIYVDTTTGFCADKKHFVRRTIANVRNDIRFYAVERYAVVMIPIHDHFLGVQLIAGLTWVFQIFNRDTKESQCVLQIPIKPNPSGIRNLRFTPKARAWALVRIWGIGGRTVDVHDVSQWQTPCVNAARAMEHRGRFVDSKIEFILCVCVGTELVRKTVASEERVFRDVRNDTRRKDLLGR